MARRAHRSSILSSSRTPDQLRVARSEHLVHFSRRRCFEHNQRPEHLTCRRLRLDVARRAHPWPGTWRTYRRSQYERYSLAVTSDGKVGPSGVVLRPLSGPGGDNVTATSVRHARGIFNRAPLYRAPAAKTFSIFKTIREPWGNPMVAVWGGIVRRHPRWRRAGGPHRAWYRAA